MKAMRAEIGIGLLALLGVAGCGNGAPTVETTQTYKYDPSQASPASTASEQTSAAEPGPRTIIEKAAAMEAPETAPRSETAEASPIPDGRYRLTWEPVPQEGAQVAVKVKSAPGAPVSDGREFLADFVRRDGKLSGCVLTLPGDETPARAECKMEGEKLLVVLGGSGVLEGRMIIELERRGDGTYRGPVSMRSPLLPGGRVLMGQADLIALS